MFEGWSFKTWKWHSINLVPNYTLYSVCGDEKPYRIVGRSLQLTVFGFIIDVMCPSSEAKRVRSCEVYGPLWSRKRKRWYKAPRHA